MGSESGGGEYEPDHFDEVCEVLADRHRRILVETTEPGEVWAVEELIECLARELEEDVTTRELRVILRHRHLPRLAEAGVVDYDLDREAVRRRDDELVAELLNLE